jgi:uncharacterized membrane protein HdeD (DUF308 family)
MESLLLGGLLVAPFALLFAASRLRKAREAGVNPWDKSLRNGMLLAVAGFLLVPAGLVAFANSRRPLFAIPVVVGVVLLARGYRVWMSAVARIPDD